MEPHNENELLRSAALQNAHSILMTRQKAERELVSAKEALEHNALELDRSLAMMRATLEATTDGILVTDGEGNVKDFNRRFVEIWGLRSEDMRAKTHFELAKGFSARFKDRHTYPDRVRQIYRDSPAQSYDLLELADGRVFERFSRPQLIGDVNVGRVWSLRDITAQKQTEERLRLSEQQLRATFEQASVGIAMANLTGIFTSVNAKFAEITGYSERELLQMTFRDLTHPDDLGQTDENVAKLLRGDIREYSYEKRFLRKDGEVIWSSTNVTLLRNNKGIPTRFVGVIEDFSSRRAAQEERAQLLESERAARMNSERLGRLKDEFLATLSHELRTPLTAILGWSQLIQTVSDDPRQVTEGAQIIERSARAQSQLVGDLLDMSRIISGKMRLEVGLVSMPQVIRAAQKSIQPAANAKGVHIDANYEMGISPISGDAERLQQIMWNLLSNSVKFTPSGGKVTISVRKTLTHLAVEISDTGKGIKEEFLPHIFDRFRQEDASAARRHGGLGIGLAIVRQLTELHGGKISAESAGEGQGASFRLELPLARSSTCLMTDGDFPLFEQEVRRCIGGMPRLDGISILVVDDEADTRELVRRMLQEQGAAVVSCGSADEALEILGQEGPNVLVSDIGMPGKDGYELMRQVRARHNSIPAVALTAFARQEDKERAIAAGYQTHISKPVEPFELLSALCELAKSSA